MANCCSARCGWCGRCTDADEAQCRSCTTRPALYYGRCWPCERDRMHRALEALIRQADGMIVEAEATKQAALDLQWQLVALDVEHLNPTEDP